MTRRNRIGYGLAALACIVLIGAVLFFFLPHGLDPVSPGAARIFSAIVVFATLAFAPLVSSDAGIPDATLDVSGSRGAVGVGFVQEASSTKGNGLGPLQ